MCSCCVEQVNAGYNFKLQCEASDVTLRNLQSQILQVNILIIVYVLNMDCYYIVVSIMIWILIVCETMNILNLLYI